MKREKQHPRSQFNWPRGGTLGQFSLAKGSLFGVRSCLNQVAALVDTPRSQLEDITFLRVTKTIAEIDWAEIKVRELLNDIEKELIKQTSRGNKDESN